MHGNLQRQWHLQRVNDPQNALPPSDLSVAELEGGRFRQPCERMIRRRGARAPRQVASQPVTLAADQVEIHMKPRN